MTLLARSPLRLEERITELTGYTVLKLSAVQIADVRKSQDEAAARARAERDQRQRAKEAEEWGRLRALATQEPPSHDCPLRKEILLAREKVKLHEEAAINQPSP